MQRNITINPMHGGFDVELMLRISNAQVRAELGRRMERAAAKYPRQGDLREKPDHFSVVVARFTVGLERIEQLKSFMECVQDEFAEKTFSLTLSKEGVLVGQGLVNRTPAALVEPTPELKALRQRIKQLAVSHHLNLLKHVDGSPLYIVKLFANGTLINSLEWANDAEAISFILPPASIFFGHRNAHGELVTLDEAALSQFEVNLNEAQTKVGEAKSAFFQGSRQYRNKPTDSQPLLQQKALTSESGSISDDEANFSDDYTKAPPLRHCCRIL